MCLMSNYYVIIVPVIDIFHGAAFTVSTSMASKLVDNSELGKYLRLIKSWTILFRPILKGICLTFYIINDNIENKNFLFFFFF